MIPAPECAAFESMLRQRPEIFSTEEVAERLAVCGAVVVPDPNSQQISDRIIGALVDGQPLSVIRLGDGECGLLTFGHWKDTPCLDRHCVEALMRIQEDSLRHGEHCGSYLRGLMEVALEQADIVGVPGLWRPGLATPENTMDMFSRDPRGVAGYWRGIAYLMDRAADGAFSGRLVASAHLYIGVMRSIRRILAEATRVICITGRIEAVRWLRQAAGQPVQHIAVGQHGPCESAGFLDSTVAQLEEDLSGCVVLIGAGPWAEYYCTRVKARGGVGVDLGSGFDLLSGAQTRPIHRRFRELGLLDFVPDG